MPLGSLMRIGTGNFSKTDLVRYSLEFVIVFGGVYLAFLLTDYQEELRKGEVRLKYYDSLIHEFESLKGHLGNEERKLVKHAAVLEEIEQGKRPPIPVSDLSFLFSGGVVDAAFGGANFASLDTRILANIIRGRPLLGALEQRINMLNQLTAELMPVQLADENCCYDEEGRLLPLLGWYPELVGEIREYNRILQMVISESALPDIERGKAQLKESLGMPTAKPEKSP